jgi:hypothetical protein
MSASVVPTLTPVKTAVLPPKQDDNARRASGMYEAMRGGGSEKRYQRQGEDELSSCTNGRSPTHFQRKSLLEKTGGPLAWAHSEAMHDTIQGNGDQPVTNNESSCVAAKEVEAFGKLHV